MARQIMSLHSPQSAHLKQTTQASNGWLSDRLRMGSPVAASQYVGAMRRGHRNGADLLKRLTETSKT